MTAIVVDIGGTNFRVGVFSDSRLQQVIRHKSVNFTSRDDNGDDLYTQFLTQLREVLDPYLSEYPDAVVGIAFPGPVDEKGHVFSAPTLWGEHLSNKPVHQDCCGILNREVVILNDISAAIWRYVSQQDEDFCLFTISSGVGNKVYRQGQVLLNQQGQGGELGHCQVAFDDYALACDCGGRGHLGALVSGRGVVQLCQFEASRERATFSNSVLAQLCSNDINKINTQHFVAALQQQDPFCQSVLSRSQHYLVSAMNHLYHSIGIKRFVFIGGFCLAIGESYLQSLNQVVEQFQWFGLTDVQRKQMCQLGHNDDDHSLIGMGQYIMQQQRIAPRAAYV